MKKAQREGYAIKDCRDDGEIFLYSNVSYSRNAAIAYFCHTSQPVSDADKYGKINWYGGCRLDDNQRRAWKLHYRKGRRCVRVLVKEM